MTTEMYCGPEIDTFFWTTMTNAIYWCEGVLMLPVGCIGFFGNILAIVVLWTGKRTRLASFHYIMLALAVVDLTFIVTTVPIHAVPALSLQEFFKPITHTRLFGFIYTKVFYPFSAVFYCIGVYLIMGITVERFARCAFYVHSI